MKSLLYFFAVAVLLLAGCAKDETVFENPDNLELKKAKVPIPFKADLYSVADMDSDPLLVEGLNPDDPTSYFKSKWIISGTGSHLGRIDAENSYYKFEKSELFFENEYPFVMNTGTGKFTGANGDCLKFTFLVKQSLLDGNCIGELEITPEYGTGKFEGCSGIIDVVGGWHEDGVGFWFKTQGYLVFE